MYIVDDEEEVRKSLFWLLESVDINGICFSSAQQFLQSYEEGESDCLVLDIRMPGISGLELQNLLIEKNYLLPIIFVTAHADVPITIQAMKKGAFDFIEKPYSDQILLERIQEALAWEKSRKVDFFHRKKLCDKIATLTKREHEVVKLVLNGRQNKEIAQTLSISIKTVEAHRTNVFKKLGISSSAELFRFAVTTHLI